MSRVLVQEMHGAYAHACSMLEAFIDVCPDGMWEETFGGWPIWQQVYHAFAAIDFFTLEPGEAACPQALYEPVVASLTATPEIAPCKDKMREFVVAMKERAERYVSSLSDDCLNDINQGLSGRMNMQVTHLRTLAMLSGHMLYHLGTADAALRQKGLKGIF